MAMKVHILLLIFILFSSCKNDLAEIKVKTSNENYITELSIETTELVYNSGYFTEVQKVEGIEKLINLKKLTIALSGHYNDFSFISSLKNLEILIIHRSELKNLDFIKELKNLRVLCLPYSEIHKNEIDLKNNQKLKYLNINNIGNLNLTNDIKTYKVFSPNIINIPSSLEYLSFDTNSSVILYRELLLKLEKVPHVILGTYQSIEVSKYDKERSIIYTSLIENLDFIKSHANYFLKSANEVLPKEYRDEILFMNDIESKKDISFKMKKVIGGDAQ